MEAVHSMPRRSQRAPRRAPLMAPLLLALLCAAPLMSAPAAAQTATPKAKAPASSPGVSNAWIRLAAVSGRPAGGYLVLKGGAQADALVRVVSPKAERIELHRMEMSGSMASMKPIASVALPAEDSVAFTPGSNHLMIFGLAPDLRPGDRVPLAFHFRSGAVVQAEATVEAANATGPAGTSATKGKTGAMPDMPGMHHH